jgi:hypothetical protein
VIPSINTVPLPGIELPKEEPLLHFAARQDVLIWRPTKIT